MSAVTAPRKAKAAPVLRRPAPPAHYLARGRLYRAIVTLPMHMCERDRPLQERRVFFDVPTGADACTRLEQLLSLAWNVDAIGWGDAGLIYNLVTAAQALEEASTSNDTGLFECGSHGDDVLYVRPGDIDMFVAPALRHALETVLASIWCAPKGGAK